MPVYATGRDLLLEYIVSFITWMFHLPLLDMILSYLANWSDSSIVVLIQLLQKV